MNEPLPVPPGADQIASFARDLDRIVDLYADEFDLTYAAIIGALEIKKHQLILDTLSQDGHSTDTPRSVE